MDALNNAIVDAGEHPLPMPPFVHVNTDTYVNLFSVTDFEQCIAASIETIYILLGPSDLPQRQDPISFDKHEDTIISPVQRILGHTINTHCMVISTPTDYVHNVVKSLTTTWGPHRKSFTLRELETLVGKLGHIAISTPWLQFLLRQLYTSAAATLHHSQAHLISTSASFCAILHDHHSAPSSAADKAVLTSFHLSNMARNVHHNPRQFYINRTLCL
jgi:hypothetical protein